MFLYLVRHAEAKREEEERARPLSEKGLEDITKVASYVSLLNISIDEILHSSKLRAKQTAEVLFQRLKPVRGVKETDGLSPLDGPEIWADRLKSLQNDVVLVGHLPHLAGLASLLLCGNTANNIVSFRPGGLVCLKRDDSGRWSLQWMLTPEIVAGATGIGNYCDGL
jgi:phosphohistidine phosphatase